MKKLVTLGMVLGLAVAGAPTAAQAELVTVEVKVVDSDGEPVVDAAVRAVWDGGESEERTTTSSGRVLVDVPEGADADLHVTHERYLRTEPYTIPDAGAETVTVTVYRKSSASVTVTDADGDPVADARVRVHRGNTTAAEGRTDAAGSFSTDTIEAGEYEVSVFRTGYLRATRNVSLSGDQRVNVTVEKASVLVTFRVVDDHTDPPSPVPGARVSVERVGSTVTTNDDGENSLQVPVNSAFAVAVGKEGYEDTTREIRVGETETEVRFVVSREPALVVSAANDRVVAGQSVRVTVTDEYGDPVAGAAVALDGTRVATTDDEGVAEVAIDAAGDHDVTASAGGLQSDPTTVRAIAEGGPTPGTPSPATATPTGGLAERIPGFGAVAAVVGLVAVAVAVHARRRE